MYGFLMMPFSVMMAVMYLCGVTSKAGLAALTPFGARRMPPMLVTSSGFRSSMGISSPELKERSMVLVGAAT